MNGSHYDRDINVHKQAKAVTYATPSAYGMSAADDYYLETEEDGGERDDFEVNERLSKLTKAIRVRLIEIQLEDQDNPISDKYSNLYALALEMINNNDVWHSSIIT